MNVIKKAIGKLLENHSISDVFKVLFDFKRNRNNKVNKIDLNLKGRNIILKVGDFVTYHIQDNKRSNNWTTKTKQIKEIITNYYNDVDKYVGDIVIFNNNDWDEISELCHWTKVTRAIPVEKDILIPVDIKFENIPYMIREILAKKHLGLDISDNIIIAKVHFPHYFNHDIVIYDSKSDK